MLKNKIYLIIFFHCFCTFFVNAEETSKDKKEKTIIPIVFSSTEMGLALGFTSIHTYKQNSLSATIFYTTKNQSALFLANEHFINSNYKYKLNLKWMNFPTNFYGIGIDTKFKDQDKLTIQRIGISPSIMKKISPNQKMYFGITTDIGKYELFNYSDNKIFSTKFKDNKGAENYNYFGAGIEFDFDSRNNNFYPSKGNFIKSKALIYNDNFLKQEFTLINFTRITYLDEQNFLKFSNWILGSRINLDFAQGNVPIWLLNKIEIRGIESSRFYDKNSINIEEEIRFQISKKIKANVFIGAGNVASDSLDFNLPKTKIGTGFGLRFVLNQKQNINLALDFAFHNVNDDEKTIYFNFQILERF